MTPYDLADEWPTPPEPSAMSDHSTEIDAPLTTMPIAQRDRIIAEVWAFLVERGYTITAPGAEPPTRVTPPGEGKP